MGTTDHPIGELFEKVNDSRYHVIRFQRSGPNATIQLDSHAVQMKNPQGIQVDFNWPCDVSQACLTRAADDVTTLLSSVTPLAVTILQVSV